MHRSGLDVRELELNHCDMTELPEEIGECVWLEHLDVRSNRELTDISPVAKLTALRSFHCYGTQVFDLSPLANLTALEEILCQATQVSDLSPLAGLTNLNRLECGDGQRFDSPQSIRAFLDKFRVRVFVSYAHRDLEYLKELRSHLAPLARLNKLQFWDDRDIDAGDDWQKVIFQQLDEADIVLCLVSADFVASDFCWKEEFGKALEAHRRGEKTIVPIRLRSCNWDGLPIAELQGTPGKWLGSLLPNEKDAAWTEVCKRLEPALAQAKQRKKVLLEKRRGM